MSGFFDALLGRSRPVKSKVDKLFAMSTAYLTLTVDFQQQPGGRAGICFRPVTNSRFSSLETELAQMLDASGSEFGTKVQTTTDSYGFQWVILEDEQFEDLVTTIHMVSITLHDSGFGEQLLAATFKFIVSGGPMYWVYNYKRGAFYPFAPTGDHRRDNPTEIRMSAVMEHELPIEKEVERWYPLWGIPV